MRALVASEAAIVAEVFDRFLDGQTLRSIAWDLNARSVPTANGGAWTIGGVARLIDAPRYAGLRVFRGQVSRNSDGDYHLGTWESCVSIAQWERARAVREGRNVVEAVGRKANRPYLLTGLLVCLACGQHLAGSVVDDYRMYACPTTNLQATHRCSRCIGADTLESYVEDRAVEILEDWDDQNTAYIAVTARQPLGIARGLGHTRTPEPVDATHRTVIVRPADALDGVQTGPGARHGWGDLSAERKGAVLRFFFSAIRIGPKTTSRCVFDYGRVEVVPHTF